MNMRLLEPTFEPWEPRDSQRQIAVLMSGGVDSSVAALLLKQAGWEVLGITMKIPVAQSCENARACCGEGAAFVCRDLGIGHYFLDVGKAFEELVIERFRREYGRGRTPSPCVDCNTDLKFGLVWDFLKATFGISYLASGHYGRIVEREKRWCLLRTAEKQRDQSYFLYGIPGERLGRLILPLGELSKQEVRQLASEKGLEVARKLDSMELCFAGQGDYRVALGEVEAGKGAILDVEGKMLGEHEDIRNYTIGQRRGLGVAAGEPLYVVGISTQDNSVTLGTWEQACRRDVRMEEVKVLCPEKLQAGRPLFGQIRSGGQGSPCVLREVGEAAVVEFEEPQFAPCPGQRLVLYEADEVVVAGGTISYS